MQTKEIVSALATLAQEFRLAVFRLLVSVGPSDMAANKIAEQLGMVPSSLSFHLGELTHAGLILPHPEGRFIRYAANLDAMNGLTGFLTENCCDGNVCTPHGLQQCAPSTANA